MTDPLTLAAKRLVDAGVTVVTAAGNLGKNAVTGKIQYGGITAPGNAPWVLTVGAYSHEGTITRTDDKIGPLQLARPDGPRFPGEAGRRRDRNGHRLAVESRQPDVCDESGVPAEGQRQHRGDEALPEPDRDEHGFSVVAGTVALMLQANRT
jgi:subtilisin family serine protease